ncbi:MAG: lamin tail domain-containing protein [Eubacteriaceae bacterium]|nr:lamin tail domain-containing protein [Eubacteriaceae bacterium]
MNKKQLHAILTLLFAIASLAAISLTDAGENKVNQEIVFNEVLTANTELYTGRDRAYYTWIELKNISKNAVDLSNSYLSDEANNPLKFAMPNVSVEPGAVLLIYCSGKFTQQYGELHAPFELDAVPQTLTLTKDGAILSRLSVPKLDRNISYGFDGINSYAYYLQVTPGAENSSVHFSSAAEIGLVAKEGFPVFINEIAASKQMSVYDESGRYEDFIELYNDSPEDVSLTGFFLSDENSVSAKYMLPNATVPAKGYLLVFAAGSNAPQGAATIHLPFKMSAGEHVYFHNERGALVDSVAVPATSDNVSYGRSKDNRAKWLYFPAPTPGRENSTIGLETNGEAEIMKGSSIVVNEVLTSSLSGPMDAYGMREDVIELANTSSEDVSLYGYSISDSRSQEKWAFAESDMIKAGGYLLLFASGRGEKDAKGVLHANFKLSKDADSVYLFRDGILVDALSYGKMRPDISYGLISPRRKALAYFDILTFGKRNASAYFTGFCPPPKCSLASGFYSEAQRLELACALDGVEIRYTTDGSDPTSSSKLYTSPVTVKATVALRFAAFREGWLASDPAAQTFVFGKDVHGLPAVFMSGDSDEIFRIYNGPIGSEDRAKANIELLEPGGGGFSEGALIRKHGNMSSLEPQKSFAISFREEAGAKELVYPLFPDDPSAPKSFRSFLLRTSGNDWDDLKCKDGMIAMLAASKMDVDTQSYRPAVLFINGEYWGVYNIREQQNEDYLFAHHGIDPNNVDIISFGHGIHEGGYEAYDELISFVKSNDLNDPKNWQALQGLMDVNNMIDTYLCHIYYSNFDTVNIKWYRERKEGAKWRWLLYDLDYAFYVPSQNNLLLITNPSGHGVNNYFPSTLIYSLMKSRQFRSLFLERLSAYWGNIFNSDEIFAMFDDVYDTIKQELPDNFRRWKISFSHHKDELETFDDFLRKRPEMFRSMAKNYFGLTAKELNELLPSQTVTHKKLSLDKSVFRN